MRVKRCRTSATPIACGIAIWITLCRLAERAEPELRRSQQVVWLNCLKDEMDNLHAALDWSLEVYVEAGMRLASALYEFTTRYGSVSALAERLLQLLKKPEAQTHTLVRAKALETAANLVSWSSEMGEARTLAEASLALYRELGDVSGEAHCLDSLGTIVCLMDDYETGRPQVLESLRLYRELGDQRASLRPCSIWAAWPTTKKCRAPALICKRV